MGFFTNIGNIIFALILIVLGINYFYPFNFLLEFQFWYLLYPLILLVLGYLFIRMSKVRVVGRHGELRPKRKTSIVIIGIVLLLFGLIQALFAFDIIIPFLEILYSGWLPGTVLIIFAIILILIAFGFANKPVLVAAPNS